MTEKFLKVNKDLFKLGLNPNQILILSQVLEFNTNTGDCYITNVQLSKQFGVSVSTIKRDIDKLEQLGYLTRETKPSQKGKDRRIFVNIDKIDENIARFNLNLGIDNDISARFKMNLAEGSNCTLRKEQNEPIKDNNELDNSKDNIAILQIESWRF